MSLFDVYRGDKIPKGKKQYAMSFVLRDDNRTMTDDEVDRIMARILDTFKTRFGAELR